MVLVPMTRLNILSTAIKYPPLEKDRRLIVWKRFFELAGCTVDRVSGRVTAEDLDWLASKPFNGENYVAIIVLRLTSSFPVHYLVSGPETFRYQCPRRYHNMPLRRHSYYGLVPHGILDCNFIMKISIALVNGGIFASRCVCLPSRCRYRHLWRFVGRHHCCQ